MKHSYVEKHPHREMVRRGLCLFSFLLILFSVNIAIASHRNGGGTTTTPAPALPPATVTPLPFEGPAPWGTDPATIPGVVITGAITGSGFLSEVITLPTGEKFWYQKIESAGFLNEAYIKKENVFQDFPTDPKGSVDVSGNTIFNLEIEDPSEGFSLRTWKDGFKSPISIHADIVESKVAALTSGGFNEMDMHFSQTPFQDASTGQIMIRQDVGVWITGINGLEPNDVTEKHEFVPSLGDLRRTTAIIVPNRGQRSRGDDDKASHGDIDWWNDFEMVKIADALSDAIVSFSRCSDYGDPTGRLEKEFEDAARDNGSRGGCSNGAAGGGLSGGDKKDKGVPRPAIPDHQFDDFQLNPFNFDRWGGAGSGLLSSGGLGFGGGTTPFPAPASNRRNRDDD